MSWAEVPPIWRQCFELDAVYMSDVKRLRYAARDRYAGSTNLIGTTPYLHRKQVEVDDALGNEHATQFGDVYALISEQLFARTE